MNPVRAGLFLCGLLVLPVTAFSQAAEREITGAVVSINGVPLEAALVQLRGTNHGASTDGRGRFSLRVPSGDVILVVRRIGHRQMERLVTSSESSVRFEMEVAAVDLNEIVVSGQATGVERRHLATAVTTVDGADLTRVSQQTIEHSMQGKIPNVQISQRTGAPGGGNWVRIRGISTITAGQTTPLYVVDGVLVADTYQSNNQSRITGGQQSESPANRITDLDPNDIERIEVLKGPTAAAIYGSKAAMGVVLITTKRGQVGRLRWTGSQGFGTSELAYRHGHRRWTYDAAIAQYGNAAAPFFDPATKEPLLDLDYEDLAYGERPLHSDLAISASGGTVDTRFFLSLGAREEGGIVRNTNAQKYTARTNVDQIISNTATLQLGASLMRTSDDRAVFDNENNPGSSVGYTIPRVPSFLDLRQRPDGSWPLNPLFQANPLQSIALERNHGETWRGLFTGQLRWDFLKSPQQDLRIVTVGGGDALMQRFEVLSPPELQNEAQNVNAGKVAVADYRSIMANLNVNVVHIWRPSTNLTVTTQVGSQYERWDQDGLYTGSSNLGGGLEVVNAGASTTFGITDSRMRVDDFGTFAQTEWLWWDRLLFTAGARADRSSANADGRRFFVFPKSSLSYRLDRVGVLDDLKLRAAFGETGNRPYPTDKFTTLGIGAIGGLTTYRVAARTAAPDLRPERQREFEGGLDASAFDRRLGVELTAFRRFISDILLDARPAPSTGYTSSYMNIGKFRTHGYEAAFSAVPVQGARLTWTTRATWGMTRSMVIRLAGDTISFRGSRLTDGQVWLRPGHSATEIMGLDTLSTTPVRIGDGAPDWTAGWSHEVRWGPFTAYALIDHQQGGRLWAGTWKLYDDARNSSDYAVVLSDGRLLGDVRNTAALLNTRIRNQDATYTKLREVTLGWDLSPGIARMLGGARAARLQLSGRNLVWWTRYRGGDPEAENFFGGFDLYQLQRNRELAAYPASRSMWLTLRADF